MKSIMGMGLWLAVLLTATGCYNVRRGQVVQPAPAPPPPYTTPSGGIPAAPPVAPPPPPGMQQISPQAGQVYGVPQNPPPGPPPGQPPGPPPGAAVSPFPTVPPPAAPNNTSGAAAPSGEAIAQVENRWQPVPGGVRLGTPIGVDDGRSSPRMYPPQSTEPPLNNSATTLPVGIPQFAMATDNVATGLRPSLDEGLDWLKARGYRTVVFIRTPGENDEPDRKQVERRGMKYVSIEVSPTKLTKEIVQDFSKLVREVPGQPVFFYDRDGSLAGGLWYLYFRTAEQFPDDVARVRAGSLGLREDQQGNHREMWLAVQKFLSDAQ
jgi:protein tyrosine phosphatase (PTP) superfamily phosphohydrolase (DUF442 family)